jgi:hypothetical protein
MIDFDDLIRLDNSDINELPNDFEEFLKIL